MRPREVGKEGVRPMKFRLSQDSSLALGLDSAASKDAIALEGREDMMRVPAPKSD